MWREIARPEIPTKTVQSAVSQSHANSLDFRSVKTAKFSCACYLKWVLSAESVLENSVNTWPGGKES
jgi:hypothetical protein